MASALWAWNFHRGEEYGDGRRALLSELGAVYVMAGDAGAVDDGYCGVPAGENGVLEEETGGVRRRWVPVRSWSYYGTRIVAVQWWAIAAAWGWRRGRRRCGGRGFDVLRSVAP
jgi:hypothetical protein